MNNLVQEVRISSLEVAKLMDMSEHSKLLRKIDGISETLAKAKIVLSEYWVESTYKDVTGRTLRCYLVTKKGCEMLAHKSTGERGIIFTHRYIQRFEEMERQLNAPKLPQTYKEALICLVQEIEEKEKLQETLEVQKPKVEYFDKLVDRKVNLNIRDTAKELGVKQTVFVNFLLEKKFLYRNRYYKLLPYSVYTNTEKNFFAMREFATDVNDGIQTLVTPKGRQYFLQRLRKEGIIQWEEEERLELSKTN